MPTEIVKYVDPDGGILADYTSLQAAITAEKAIRSNLVARDEVLKLMCISSAGSPDTTPVVINSGDFVTDATRKIVVKGDNSTGIWDAAKYCIIATTNAITVNIGNILFQNLQLEVVSYTTPVYCILQSNTSARTVINNCIFNSYGGAVIRRGIMIEMNGYAGTNTVIVANSVFCNFRGAPSSAAIRVYSNASATTNLYAYNVTINDSNNGLYVTNNSGVVNVIAKNVITQNCTDGFNGTFATGSDYNISDLAGDAPGANSLNSTTVNFADAANGDFRLLAGSPGIDQGVDLSADPSYPFNTAIDGTIRPQGSAWDIGAFELIQQSFNPAWAKHSNQIIRAI